MVLVLDTADVAEPHRADALRAAMRTAGVPAHVTPLQSAPVQARLNLWELDGAGSTLMHRVGTGLGLERTPRQVRMADPDRIGLTLLPPSRWTFAQHRAEHAAHSSPRLVLVHHASPYEHRRLDYGTTIAVNMERSLLEVPVQTVIRAGQNLNPNCPLHALVCGYLDSLARTARDSPTSVASVAATTTHLIRALIHAAAGDVGHRESLHASLIDRIKLYIHAHLADPDLTPDAIAAAHHISVRHLYQVWRTQDSIQLSLANWIMAKRLELAANRLSDRTSAHLTVAAIGRMCGFVDPTHFGRRFRVQYGMTPREWRLTRR